MEQTAKKYFCFFMLLTGLFASGCTTLLPGTDRLPLLGQIDPLPSEPLCRIAVLPFVNETEFPMGEAIVSKIFAAEFQNQCNFKVVMDGFQECNHRVIQEGDILKTYQQLNIIPGRTLSEEQMLIIGDRVRAQLLITGRILEMKEERAFAQMVNPQLFLEIKIFDGRSGKALWTTFHRRQGTDYHIVMHFGTIQTVTGLSKQMAVEIINLWLKKGQDQCDV